MWEEILGISMHPSYLVIGLIVLVGGCAHPNAISSASVTHWENRDVSELIAVIGPFDTTSIQGDSRTYFWSRFGSCRVTARTTREEKIAAVDVQGTTQGCSTYLQKMGEGETSSAKP
jgi:hypothetical protein